MNLLELVNRSQPPQPWADGYKIPWDDPDFSARMLHEHLTQNHDHASRGQDLIDQHVAWIHTALLGESPARVLDLCCGPGLYAQRMTALGHTVTGIDFGPASIAHARAEAQKAGLTIDYQQADVREADFGADHDLAMLIYGEVNVFTPDDLRAIFKKAFDALKPGGVLLLEPTNFDMIKSIGEAGNSWYSTPSGLFSGEPHLYLEEHAWDAASQTATIHFYIIDAASAEVTRYAQSMIAYEADELPAMLTGLGFADVTRYPSLSGQPEPRTAHMLALVARRATE